MVKVIAFDLGGVLFAEGNSVAAEKLAGERGYDRDRVLELLVSPKSIELRKGVIDDAEFWAWAQHQVPEHYDVRLIKREWYSAYLLDEDVLRLITKLKAGYKIMAFSGNIKSRIDFLEEQYHFRSLFDVEVYSFMHGLSKWDRGFAEVMIRESGVRPGEIVYVDDNDRHALHARNLGVKVLIYARGQIDRLRNDLKSSGVAL